MSSASIHVLRIYVAVHRIPSVPCFHCTGSSGLHHADPLDSLLPLHGSSVCTFRAASVPCFHCIGSSGLHRSDPLGSLLTLHWFFGFAVFGSPRFLASVAPVLRVCILRIPSVACFRCTGSSGCIIRSPRFLASVAWVLWAFL